MGKWIAWQIGNGSKVRIGEDPWMGVKGNFILFDALLEMLQSQLIYHLRDVASQVIRNIWA